MKKNLSSVKYRIELTSSLRRSYDVVHVLRLKPYRKPVDEKTMKVVVDLDGTEEQEVFSILDKQRHKLRIYYLEQFLGESADEAMWMHKTELKNCRKKYPSTN